MKRTVITKAKRIPKRIRILGQKTTSKKEYPSGYDSYLEYDLSTMLGTTWDHHPDKITYTSTHTYEPDFRKLVDGKVYLIEAKGRFRTRNESAKYLFVRQVLKPDEELLFIFQDSDKPLVGSTKRKDGTKQSHGEWAAKNNFRFFCLKQGLPDNFEEVLCERDKGDVLPDQA